MDVVIARQGNCCQDMEMALKYTVGKEYSCELMGYVKVKALEITSTTDEVIRLDGEVVPGPNPFRFVTIPSLLTVFGEYSSVCLRHLEDRLQRNTPTHIVFSYKIPVYNSQPV